FVAPRRAPPPTLYPSTSLFRSFINQPGHQRHASGFLKMAGKGSAAHFHPCSELINAVLPRQVFMQVIQPLIDIGILGRDGYRLLDRKSTRLNSSHVKSSYAVSL